MLTRAGLHSDPICPFHGLKQALVEVIGTEWTAADVIERTLALHRAIGKQAVHVKRDVPGFVGSRLQHALWREAVSLVEHGVCDAETVDIVIKAAFGRRLGVLGPLENADLVGTDLTLAIHRTVLPAVDNTPGPSPYLEWLVADGKLGMKTGEGFRTWTEGQQAALRRAMITALKRAREDDARAAKERGGTTRMGTAATETIQGGATRRTVIGSALGALAAPATVRAQAGRTIKIGFVNPRTGPLAAFGEADGFVLDALRRTLAPGLQVGGRTYPVQIIERDSQSSPTRAAEVASELILREHVDLLTAASTPDTVNPVADQAEVNEVPCVTTNCPWQAYFFGRRGDPRTGFEWTWHFFWGLEDVIAAYTDLWSKAGTNRVVGGLFPNDADGNAWGDAERGMPPALAAGGWRLVDTGRFQPFSNDFSAQIGAFKAAGVQIVTGALTPPDFATFWTQAGQAGFRPKVVTIAKALLFPSAVAALGERGAGLTTEIWWSPAHPFRSSLTGQTAAELCAAYTATTRRPWTQPIGYVHSLFEVAVDALKRSTALEPEAIVRAVRETDLRTITGPVRWTGQPVKNVARTPLVAGQWRRAADGALDLVVLANPGQPEIPVGGTLDPLG